MLKMTQLPKNTIASFRRTMRQASTWKNWRYLVEHQNMGVI